MRSSRAFSGWRSCEERRGGRSEVGKVREVNGSGIAHLVLVGAVLMASAVGLLGVDGVNVGPEHNTSKNVNGNENTITTQQRQQQLLQHHRLCRCSLM